MPGLRASLPRAAIAATARNAKALGALADSVSNIHAFAGDITDREGMAALVEAIERDLGPIDLAVLNAGIYLPTNFPNLTPIYSTGLLRSIWAARSIVLHRLCH